MSSIRDQILATKGELKEETVVIASERGEAKVIVRELSARDRNEFVASFSKLTEDAGGDYHAVPVSDPLRQARLVALSTFDDSGERVFSDADIEALGDLPASALDAVSKVASRLSGLGGDAVTDAGKDSEQAPGDASSSN